MIAQAKGNIDHLEAKLDDERSKGSFHLRASSVITLQLLLQYMYDRPG